MPSGGAILSWISKCIANSRLIPVIRSSEPANWSCFSAVHFLCKQISEAGDFLFNACKTPRTAPDRTKPTASAAHALLKLYATSVGLIDCSNQGDVRYVLWSDTRSTFAVVGACPSSNCLKCCSFFRVEARHSIADLLKSVWSLQAPLRTISRNSLCNSLSW